MIVRELVTLLGFETDENSLRRAEMAVRATADRMVAIGQRMSLFLTVPLVAAAAGMVKAASDATELQNKFNMVFRGMEDDANSWAETFAKTVGRSKFIVKESMASFQSFFVGMGFGADEAQRMSRQMQELTIDFGSFNNVSDEEAAQRFIAAMSGSAEVLDRFGINLKASALDIELQAQGLAKSTAKANEQQKAIARLALIQKAMTSQGAVGDAVRTLHEFANRLRQVKSVVRDVAVTFGAQMVPGLNKLLAVAIPVLGWINNLSDSTKRYILIVGALVAAIGPLMIFGGTVLKLIMGLTPAIRIAIIIGALLALVIEDIMTWLEGGSSVIGMFLGSWQDFRAKLIPILLWLKEWFTINLPIMLNNLKNIIVGVIIPTIITAAQQVWKIISPLVLAIVELVKIAWGFIVSLWERFSPVILKHLLTISKWCIKYLAGIVDAVITAVGGVLKILGGLLRFLGGVFTLNWKEAWEGIKDIFFGIIDVIAGAFKALVAGISGAINGLKSAVGLRKDLATEAVKAIPGVIKTVGTAAIVAGTGLGETGENISTKKFIEGARATAGASQTIQLQPIVNVEVGQVRSQEDAAQVADMTSQAVNNALAEQARNIQSSFPEIE